LRTTRKIAFCSVLSTLAVRMSSALRPNFVRPPRRYDFGHGFPSADERAGISLKARVSFDWNGFAGEHRLVDKDGSVDQSNVGGNDGAQRQLHHIALYQLGRR